MEKRSRANAKVTMIALLLLVSAVFAVMGTNTVAALEEGDYFYSIGGSPLVSTITGYNGTGGVVTLPSSLGGYSVVAIGNGAFNSAKGHLVTSVTIASTVTSIGHSAFWGCSSLTSVTIPEGVTSIGDSAFYFCMGLTSVTIPSTVTSIGTWAFFGCSAMTDIFVDADNPNYADVGGILYDKDITTLMQCPAGKPGAVIVPSSVTTIADESFDSCALLTSVTIPNGVIGKGAFASCTALTSVTLGAGVTSIGKAAFSFCSSLTSISFLGLVAPSVGMDWIYNTPAGIRGHAYAASNFPAPGAIWNGLIMGALIPIAVPGAPTDLSVTPGNAQATLAWTSPADTGGSSIIGYRVYRSTAEAGAYALISSPSGTDYENTGLSNGQVYWYKVSSVNAIGESANCSAISATPVAAPTVPDAPIMVSIVPGRNVITITWAAPLFDGGSPIQYYWLYWDTVDPPVANRIGYGSTVFSIEVSGLAPGTTYYMCVTALNEAGQSAKPIALSAMAYTYPGAPILSGGSAGVLKVGLTWTAPSNTGYTELTGYKVFYGTTSTPATQFGTTLSAATLSTDITGLSAGTLYYFAVKAVNAAGDSPLSNVRSGTPTNVPGSPTLSAVAGAANITLTWTVPANNASAITGYNIYRGTGPEAESYLGSVVTTTLIDTAVVVGPTYYYRVTAINSIGEGAMSNEVQATLATGPDNAPTLVSATPGNAQVRLVWAAPVAPLELIAAYRAFYGTSPGTMVQWGPLFAPTFALDLSELVPGVTYYFGFTGVYGSGLNTPMSNILAATPITYPDAPSLNSAVAGPSQVTVTWSAPLNTGFTPLTGYKVFYGAFSPTIQFGNVFPATSTAVNVTGLLAGTSYFLAVKAVNAIGDSPLSNVRSAIPYTLPGAPILESAGGGASQVALMWTAPADTGSSPLTGYKIFYGTVAPDAQYEGLLPPQYNMANVMDLTPGQRYYFAIRAVNAAGDGPLSNTMAATPYTWPDPPILQSAQAGALQVSLAWSAPVHTGFNEITGYKVFFGTAFPDQQFGDELSPLVRGVNVTGLQAEVSYYFAVKAVNEAGDSDMSNILVAAAYTVPGSPMLTMATPGVGEVTVNWTAPSSSGGAPLLGYRVFYGSVAPDTPIGPMVPYSTHGLVVSGLSNGTTYQFAVKAVNLAGDGVLSNILSATTFKVPGPPLLDDASAGVAVVILTWIAPSDAGGVGIAGYKVYFGIAAPTEQFGSLLPSSARTATITGLSNGTLYRFAVVAVNALGDSPLSNVMSATPYTVPSAPTLMSAIGGVNSAVLVWSPPSSNGSTPITGYEVYYGLGDPTIPFGDVLPSTTRTVSVTGLATGSLYHFALRAINAAGNSTSSNALSATVMSLPGAPQNLTAQPGPGRVTLNWQVPASTGGGIAGYQVYRALAGESQSLGTVGASTFSYVDDTGTAGTIYTYHVVATNAVGAGADSAPVSAAPQTSNGPDNSMIYFAIVFVLIVVVILVLLLMKRRKKAK